MSESAVISQEATATPPEEVKGPLQLMEEARAAEEAKGSETAPVVETKPTEEVKPEEPVVDKIVQLGGVEIPEAEALSLAKMGEYHSIMMQTPEGRQQLLKEMQETIAELDGAEPKPNATPTVPELAQIEIPDFDEDEATPNELKLLGVVKGLSGQNNQLVTALKSAIELIQQTGQASKQQLEDVKRLVGQTVEESRTAQVAASASEKVFADIGIRKSAAQIQEAIRQTGIKDPVDACYNFFKKEVLAARSTPAPNTATEMPDTKAERTVDFDKMSPMQLAHHAREHPEDVPAEDRKRLGIA